MSIIQYNFMVAKSYLITIIQYWYLKEKSISNILLNIININYEIIVEK